MALLAGGAKTGRLDEPLVTDALDHPALLQALLQRGLPTNDVGASGRTLLMTAARLDLVDAARLLLAHGAPVDAAAGAAVGAIYQTDDAVCQSEPRPSNDTPGRTALSYAAEFGSPALVKLLLDHGADPRKPDAEDRLPADYAKRRKPILDLLGAAR
jgi:ankyrin repeat protein